MRCAISAGLMLIAPVVFGATPTMRSCPASSAPDYYFPAGAFVIPPTATMAMLKSLGMTTNSRPRGNDDSFRRRWYSGMYRAMPLLSWSCGDAVLGYRFVWLRTFHAPVAVSVVKTDKGWFMQAVELSGAGGYEPGVVARNTHKPILSTDLEHLRQLLDTANTWSAPVENANLSGLDGAQWIFELRDGARYHLIDRWTPDNGPIRSLGLAFLALTGWSFPAKEIY